MIGPLAAALMLALAACAGAAPQRIVSLSPSHTEILYALGLDREIVGVTRYCEIPRTAQARPVKIGGHLDPDIERIATLKPDLVVAGLWNLNQTPGRLRRVGLTVIEVDTHSGLAAVEEAMRALGRATGREAAGARLAREFRARLDAVRTMGRALPRRPRIYVETFTRPLWSVGRGNYVHEMIMLAGGENIFDDLGQQSATVSPELVIRRAPDVILSFQAKREEIARRPGWDSIPAVREGRIIDDIPEGLLSRMGPRLPEAAEQISVRLQRWFPPAP